MGNGTNSEGVGLPPFYVGQKVVCLTNNYKYIKKGKEYIVVGLRLVSCCKEYWIVSVNIRFKSELELGHCCYCTKTIHLPGYDYWYTTDKFAPIQENFQAIEFTKVLENELASVN